MMRRGQKLLPRGGKREKLCVANENLFFLFCYSPQQCSNSNQPVLDMGGASLASLLPLAVYLQKAVDSGAVKAKRGADSISNKKERGKNGRTVRRRGRQMRALFFFFFSFRLIYCSGADLCHFAAEERTKFCFAVSSVHPNWTLISGILVAFLPERRTYTLSVSSQKFLVLQFFASRLGIIFKN